MGIDPAQLGNYDVVTVSNSEEHQYLDAYIPSSQILSLAAAGLSAAAPASGVLLSAPLSGFAAASELLSAPSAAPFFP